jgi:hypothetical protein
MAFHTYDIVGMLVANEQFKFSSAIRAVVLVQGHRRFPPMNGNCFVITNIVVPGLDYVKMHFGFSVFDDFALGCEAGSTYEIRQKGDHTKKL